jgi:hypothetical protein
VVYDISARAADATVRFNSVTGVADIRRVSGTTRRGGSFVWLAVGISIAVLAGWVAWIAPQPPCGPPGNTQLAAADRWVPWVFVVFEFVCLTMVGVVLQRRWTTILWVVACVGTITVVCGGLIDFLIAAYGHCFA